MLKAVLFDMDGLMVDTEKLLSRFWVEAARSFGFPMTPEHVLGIRSLSRKFAAPHLHGIFGEEFDYRALRAKRLELMNAYIAENGIEMKAGLTELLDHIGRRGLKCAVCTATDHERTRRYLTSIGVYHRFDVFVCGDMISVGKPAPDTYIEGAKAVGCEPAECMALEDSPNGIESAYRAGCIPVMVPDLSQPDDELRAKLRAVCSDLSKAIPVIDELLGIS